MLEEIIRLRRELHQFPELSNAEFQTSQRIKQFIQKYNPDEVIELGETGLAFIFQGAQPGKTVVFRAELDALPILEKTELEYQSTHKNVAHSCGHDGHMAIVAGLAIGIAEQKPTQGRIILLFQPAEEVEQGALDVLLNPKFKALNPDFMFALHNVPGIERNRVILKKGSFAAASKGLTIQLSGKTSHAAKPQDGISPADAIAQIIKRLHLLRDNKSSFEDFILLTIIHIQLGEIAFGTSPGYAEIRVTLRAFENEDMELLTQKVEEIVMEEAKKEGLICAFDYCEKFPATVNDSQSVDLVESVIKELGLSYSFNEMPFSWSEDFGYFSSNYKTCYFGIGSGETHPQLHNPEYDFPDEIITTGINLFESIYKRILCNHE
jgi:amidohydrolase